MRSLWDGLECFVAYGEEIEPAPLAQAAAEAIGRPPDASGLVDHDRIGTVWEQAKGTVSIVEMLLAELRDPTPIRHDRMSDVDREGLAREIYDRTHLTGEFVLRSGAVSNEYFDKYLFESDPVLLRSIGEALVPLVPDGTEVLAGLELGGIPLATMLSQLTGLPALFVRKEAKTYGTCRLAEGGEVDGRRLTIVEDVVTSGGQVVLSAEDLRGAVRDRRARGDRHRPPRTRAPARARRRHHRCSTRCSRWTS